MLEAWARRWQKLLSKLVDMVSREPTVTALHRPENANNTVVYCLDRLPRPALEFHETADRVNQFGRQVDVSDSRDLDNIIAAIAAERKRIDGLIAAACVQYIPDALVYPPEKITEVRTKVFSTLGSNC